MDADPRHFAPETTVALSSSDASAPTGRKTGALPLIVGFWTFFGIVSSVVLVVSPTWRARDNTPEALIVFAFLGVCTWAALTLPLFRLAERLRLIEDDATWRLGRVCLLIAFSLTLSLLVSVALAFVSTVALRNVFGGRIAGRSDYWAMMRYRLPSDLLACHLILAAGIARDYFLRYRSRVAEAAILRAQIVEARLEALRAQINPHFLFNTLNSVAALVEKDPRGVRRMIALLSDLLRDSLQGRAEPEVTIEHELDMLGRYLDILKIRFQDGLTTEVSLAPDARAAMVPGLILQPLVENAMKHGAGRARGGGRIEVQVARAEDDLVLTVADSGSGTPRPAPEVTVHGGGFGLAQTRERLEQLYGARGRLKLSSVTEGGVVAEIRLPFRRGSPEDGGARSDDPLVAGATSAPASGQSSGDVRKRPA